MRPSAKGTQWSRACVHSQPSLLESNPKMKKKKFFAKGVKTFFF